MSYRIIGHLGQTPAPEAPPSGGALGPLATERGFVQIPSADVRQYVQTTLVVLAVGFGAGVGVGAIFGNILGSDRKLTGGIGKVFRNSRRRRRTSRRRPRRNSKRRRKLKRYLIRTGGGSFFEVQAYSAEGALKQAKKEEPNESVRISRSEPVKKNPKTTRSGPALRIEQLMIDGYISKADLKNGPWEGLGAWAPRRSPKSVDEALDWLENRAKTYHWHGAFRVLNARGDVLAHVRFNKKNAGQRRTTARRRKKGRPTVKPVAQYEDWVKMPEGYRHAVIVRGQVHVGPPRSKPTQDSPEYSRSPIGTVYDAGTIFRAIPRNYDDPVKEFTTLAGAVKHLVRHWEAA